MGSLNLTNHRTLTLLLLAAIASHGCSGSSRTEELHLPYSVPGFDNLTPAGSIHTPDNELGFYYNFGEPRQAVAQRMALALSPAGWTSFGLGSSRLPHFLKDDLSRTYTRCEIFFYNGAYNPKTRKGEPGSGCWAQITFINPS